MFPEIKITDSMRERAKAKYDKIKLDPERDKRRFGSEGKRILEGYIGEVVVIDYYGVEDIDDYEYDIIINEIKVDVKTISCKFKPAPHFLAAVNSCETDGEHRQNSDRYIFVRIREDYEAAWIVGYMECENFFDLSTFVKKGETFDGIKFEKANTNVLPIKSLLQVG